jgi:hypothetical protein
MKRLRSLAPFCEPLPSPESAAALGAALVCGAVPPLRSAAVMAAVAVMAADSKAGGSPADSIAATLTALPGAAAIAQLLYCRAVTQRRALGRP